MRSNAQDCSIRGCAKGCVVNDERCSWQSHPRGTEVERVTWRLEQQALMHCTRPLGARAGGPRGRTFLAPVAAQCTRMHTHRPGRATGRTQARWAASSRMSIRRRSGQQSRSLVGVKSVGQSPLTKTGSKSPCSVGYYATLLSHMNMRRAVVELERSTRSRLHCREPHTVSHTDLLIDIAVPPSAVLLL